MKLTFSFVFAASILASGTSFAQHPRPDDDYSFGGSCVSMGAWTQKALAHTAEIKDTIKRLRKIKDCEDLGAALEEEANKQPSNELSQHAQSPVAQQIENVPTREFALANFIDEGNQSFQFSALQALLKERLTLATANSFNAIKNGFGSINGTVVTGVVNEVAGLINVVSTTLGLPKYEGCLLHQPDEASKILSPIIGLSANIMGTSGGMNPVLTGSLSNVIDLLNKLNVPKFSPVMKKLNKAQFWTSMSCIIETTAEAYCSMVDADHLMNKDYLAQKVKVTDGRASFGNPLNGYEALVLHVPNIAAWIQRVQFGIEPQWDTDATFKVSALENTLNYMTSAWAILGAFNGMKNVYNRQPNVQSKRNFLLDMIKTAVGALQSGKESYDARTMGSQLNFFTQAQQRDAIPFFLIGMQDSDGNGLIPERAVRSQFGGEALPWDKYMKGTGTFKNPDDNGVIERIWSNPDVLMITIEKNLRTLIEKANGLASDFYQQRIIVNQRNLVAEAVSSPQFTVRNSFEFINGYLKELDELFSKGDPSNTSDQEHKYLFGMIRDLQHRISTALEAFEVLKKFQNMKIKTKDDRKIVEAAYNNVVHAVYDEFEVLYQRDSFITSALVELVKADYAFRIRHNIGFGQYEKDLIVASGNDFINLVRTLHGFNPVRVFGDIKQASIVHDMNVTALEHAFGDPLLRTIDEINMYIKDNGGGDYDLNKRSAKRLFEDTFINGVAQRDNPGSNFMSMLFGWPMALETQKRLREDRYQFPRGTDRAINPMGDNAVGGWSYFKSQLCILSLVFTRKGDYAEACKGAILPSLYQGNDPSFRLNASYDALLDPANSKVAGRLSDKLYKENTICAFRNYHRRNLVFRLTEQLKAGVERSAALDGK